MIAENGGKRPMGRPRVLTPEKKDDVIRFISIGGSRKMAAKFVGVAHTTIQDEEKRDDEFSARLSEAEAKAYAGHIKKIVASKDWKASAWYLGRKYPEEWAEVRKIAETNSQGQDLTAEERERHIQAILARREEFIGK